MAGYDGWTMSNNARDAYASGEMPASKFRSFCGLSTAEVRALASPSSWHHTSKRFNRTDFFSIDEVCTNYIEQFFSARRKPAVRLKLHRVLAIVSPGSMRRRRLAEAAAMAEKKRVEALQLAQHIEQIILREPRLALPPDRRPYYELLTAKQFHDVMLRSIIDTEIDALRTRGVFGKGMRKAMKSQIRWEFDIQY